MILLVMPWNHWFIKMSDERILGHHLGNSLQCRNIICQIMDRTTSDRLLPYEAALSVLEQSN